MPRSRRCFIHIGTHKTGTTALQIGLGEHRQALRQHGFLYPAIGCPPEGPHGHHNFAWEMSGDRRFRAEYGTGADLLWRLGQTSDDVILSSEDFECSVFHTQRFVDFLTSLQDAGLETILVLYLRHQIAYAPSLYQTLLQFGLDAPFEDYLDAIVANGRFCWREWVFPFCYKSFLKRLEDLPATPLVVRSYDRLVPRSLMHDFLSIFDLEPEQVGITDSLANVRPPLIFSVKEFLRNRGASLNSTQEAVVTRLCESNRKPMPDLSARAKSTLSIRFRRSNQEVYAKYVLPPAAADIGTTTGAELDDDLPFEAFFSPELESGLRKLAS